MRRTPINLKTLEALQLHQVLKTSPSQESLDHSKGEGVENWTHSYSNRVF